MAVSHVLSATTPDDPAYEIRPSHWNSGHNQFLTISGNTAGQSTFSGTNLVFSGGPNATLSIDGNTLVFSGGAGAAGNTGYISGGTTNASLGTVSFADSNGVSFGVNGQTLTASHNGLTSQSNQAASAANGSFAFQTLSFSNLNGISFGTSAGSAITASHNALTSQSNQAFSADGGSSAFQTLNFRNANGLSFSNSAGSVQGSYTVPSTAGLLSNINVSAGTTSNNLSALTFSNSNGISFGLNASTLTASHNALTSQSNQAVSNSAGSFTFQTLNFSDANNVTWGTSAGGIVTASVAAPGAAAENNWHHLLGANTAGNTTASGSTIGVSGINLTLSGTNGSVFNISAPATSSLSATGIVSISTNGSTISIGAAQSNQTVGGYFVGNTTGQSSSSTVDARSVSIDGAGIISAGWSNGSIRISATVATSLTNINVSAGTTSNNLSAITFSNANGVTFGLNASTITASVAAGGGAAVTMSMWPPEVWAGSTGNVTVGQSSLIIMPCPIPGVLHMDRVVQWGSCTVTTATNSSVAATLSRWAGLYTRNASTLSLYTSGSQTWAITNTSNNSTASINGLRVFTIPLTATLSDGQYWLGLLSASATAGNNALAISNFVWTCANAQMSGHFASANNTTVQPVLGSGRYTAQTAAMPGSIAFSQIQMSAGNTFRYPFWALQSGTV